MLLFLVFSALAAAAPSVLAAFLPVAGLRTTAPVIAVYDANALTSVLAAVASVVACLTAVVASFVSELGHIYPPFLLRELDCSSTFIFLP